MLAKISGFLGAIVAVALVVIAIWSWGAAVGLSQHTERPDVVFWAIRSAAVAAFFGAQVLGMTFVVGAFYSRGKIGEWVRVAAGMVCTAALVGAMALLIASK